MTILLGTRVIEYPPLRPTPDEQQEMAFAGVIAEFFIEYLNGNSTETETWIELAELLGCDVHSYHVKGAARGEYASNLNGDRGVITYNTAVTTWQQVQTLIHELTHHALVVMGAVSPPTADTISGDPVCNFGHNVARRVEKYVRISRCEDED